MKYALKSLFATALIAGSVASHAAIVAIDAASFVVNAGQITFSEAGFGTTTPANPTYTAAQYGGTGSAPGVSFGSFFMGQATGSAATCPAFVALSGCIVNLPGIGGLPAGPVGQDAPLALDLIHGTGVNIVTDTAHTNSPVLSGSPFLNGSIAMLFTTLQAGVAFDGGFFNAIGTTRVTAYDRDGVELGFITNGGTGIQFLGIGTSDGIAQIAGILISLVAPEDSGFSIDNIRFSTIPPTTTSSSGTTTSTSSTSSSSSTSTSSTSSSGSSNPAPEPSSMALVGLALLGLAFMRRRMQR